MDHAMSRFYQEFFWTPNEIIPWLKHEVTSLGLWVVLSPLRENANLFDVNSIHSDGFFDLSDEGIEIFLGDEKLLSGPSWRIEKEKRQLDFKKSYAVQLVPPIFVEDRKILLQGRMAILDSEFYEDPERAKNLIALFRKLKSSMKKNSDDSRYVRQKLSNGQIKIWKSMFVGKKIPKTKELQFKQFANGAVTFYIE
jgi:hypothetical protein